MNNISEEIASLDKPFSENRYNGPNKGPICEYKDRKSKLILISVHGVNHYKEDGTDKVVDLFTGGITLFLANKLSCSYVINKRKHPSINPHNNTITPAAKYLKKISNPDNIIIDIHGAKNNPYDFYWGTGYYPNEEQLALIQIIREYEEFKHFVNAPRYSAKNYNTMTKQSIRMGNKKTLQLELIRDCRDYKTEKGLRAIETLINIFKRLNSL